MSPAMPIGPGVATWTRSAFLDSHDASGGSSGTLHVMSG